MPFKSSESSKSSDSDEFDLKHLLRSRHLRRARSTDPSSRARSGSLQRGEGDGGDDDVVVSPHSSLNMAKTRSDWTRRSCQSTREVQNGGMSQTNPLVDEYDDGRDSFSSTRGPYHALQLAADRLTGEMQDGIAQQLEAVEEQLEAVGLQMQETIAAGLKDGTFGNRLRSSMPSGRRSIPAHNPQPLVNSRKRSALNFHLKDRSSQTSPSSKRYSSHASSDPRPNGDASNAEVELPVRRKSEAERKLFRQSRCPLGACECEDTSEDGISEPSIQQYVPDSFGYEYQILKLEGVAPNPEIPERKVSTSRTRSVVSRDSTSTSSDQSGKSEARIYHARGCQTCRCHSCRVPSDPVQTVQILGVVDNAKGGSSATGSREFVTMDVKNGRISENLGLIEICRDYEAQEGEYDQTWKPASVLQQLNIERSGGEIRHSLIRHQVKGVVDGPVKQFEPEETAKRDLEEESESSKESSEGPYSGDWQKDILRSKSIHQRGSHSKGRGIREIAILDAEAEYPAGQSSPAKNHPQREVQDKSLHYYERDDGLSKGIEGYVPSYGASSSGRANDLTLNVRSEIFSVIDKEFEYSANDSTSSQSTPNLYENPNFSDYGSRLSAPLKAEGVVERRRTSKQHVSSPRREQNFSDRPEARFVSQEQRHSSPTKQETEAHGFRIPEVEAVKFEEANLLSSPSRSHSKERHRSKSHLSSIHQPELRTRSWSHQKRQSDRLDSTTQDEDDGSFVAGERTHDNPLFVEANEEVEINGSPRTDTKEPLMASSSSYQFKPSMERVSSCLTIGEASAGAGYHQPRGNRCLDFPSLEPRPDKTAQTWSSDKSREMEIDEARNRNVAQSRVYIDIRQEYEPGDDPSPHEMQSRMQEEIAKEFALLGIHSSPPQIKMSINDFNDKVESEGPRSNHRTLKANSARPDIPKVEEGLPHLDNVYRDVSDLKPLAGQLFSSSHDQEQVSNAPSEHSRAGTRGSALARILDDAHGGSEPRSGVSQKSKSKSKNVRIGERQSIMERSRRERKDFVEPQAVVYTDVAHRRPTPYPIELSADARLRKVELLQQLQNTENIEDSPAQRPIECAQKYEDDHDESRNVKYHPELDQQDRPAGGGQIPMTVTKATGSGSNQDRNVSKGPDAIVQILDKKSSRFGGRRRSRETSIQHSVSNIPRDNVLLMPPIAELLGGGSKSRRQSIAQIEVNANMIPGLRGIESLDSSIPTRSRRLVTDIDLLGQFRDSRTRGSQPTHVMPPNGDDMNPCRHPTMIDQNWNVVRDSEDHEDGNIEMLTKRNLQTLNSKSSQKYLAKMLSRLSQKLEVLESKGLIDSQSPRRQGSEDSESQQQRYDHLSESKSQDFLDDHLSMRKSQDFSNDHLSMRKSQDFSNDHHTRRKSQDYSDDLDHLNIRKSQDYSNDHLCMRKSQDFSNQLTRGTRGPMYMEQDFHRQTQDTAYDEFIGAQKIPPMTDARTSQNHQHFRESMLANNLQLLFEEMESRRNQNSKKQELPEEWLPRTPHRFSLTEQTEGREAKSRHHHELGSQTPEHSFKDTPIRSSLHYQTQMTDKWEARNRQSIQTQTLNLNEMNSQDEMQPSYGHEKVPSRRYSLSEASVRPRYPSNSEELQWDRSLERWNPRASRGGQLNLRNDDLKESLEQAQAQGRNSTIAQTEDFGSRGHPSFQPQFHEHSQSQRMDSMVTQPGDLEFRGSPYFQNQFQRSDPRFLSGEQISQFMDAGSHQNMHSQDQRSNMPLQNEATEFRDSNSQSQVLQQSDLQDLERRSRQLSQIQRMNSTLQVQHEMVNGMILGNQQHSQIDRMHSFAVQPEGMDSMVSNPLFSLNGLPEESDVVDGRNLQHSHTGRMYSLAVQPETMESGTRHHSQSGRMYSHVMQPEGMNPGFHHHSQSGRLYSYAVQPEEMDFGNRLPSQSGGMYGASIQSEDKESGNRQHSQIDGTYVFPDQSETIESQIRHPSKRVRMSNFPVQPEGIEFENRQQSQIGGMYAFPEQSETMQSQSRHTSQQTVRMSNFPVQPEGVDIGFRHHSQGGTIYSHDVQAEGMDSAFHNPSQSGRIGSFAVQQEGMDPKGVHNSLGGGMYGHTQQPELVMSRHPSQGGRMSNLLVPPIDLGLDVRHQSQIERRHNFAGQHDAMDFGSRHPSQNDRMQSFAGQSGAMDNGSRHPSQIDRMQSFVGQSGAMDPGSRHPSQIDTMQSFVGQSGAMDPGSRHPSQIDNMQSFVGQSGAMDNGSRLPSQIDRMQSFGGQSGAMDNGSRHPSQIDKMQSFVGQSGAVDPGSRHPSQIDKMQSFVVQSFSVEPGVLDGGDRHPSQIDRMQSLVVQPEDTDYQKEQIYNFEVQPEFAESISGRHSRSVRMLGSGVQPETVDSGIRKTPENRVPEIRTSHHSLVRMPENSSEDFEALQTERKTSSGRDPVNDLPPEVLSLGSKNPRKSSQIQMLNDMLQDLEATVSKSRQNSQARMKSHMLVHEFDAVAQRGSKILSKNLSIQAPKEEQTKLEKREVRDKSFEPKSSKHLSKKLTIQYPQEEQPKLEGSVDENFDRIAGKKLDNTEVENSGSPPGKPEGKQPETFPDQLEGENLQLNEDELADPRPEQSDNESLQLTEDEQSVSHSEHYDEKNLDGEVLGSYQGTPEIIPGESPAAEQQDLQSDQDGSLHPVDGSDRLDSLTSHRSDDSEYSSGNSSGGTLTSSAYNSQRRSHPAGSQSHSQTLVKDKAHQPEEAEPDLLHDQSSYLMLEEVETDGTSDSAYLAEGEGEGEGLTPLDEDEELTPFETQGEELTPFETQGEELTPLETQGEELTAFETQGEELTSLETQGEELTSTEAHDQGDFYAQESPAEAPQTDERRVSSRTRRLSVDEKPKDPKGKGKGKNLDSIVKDFISGGSSSRRKSS